VRYITYDLGERVYASELLSVKEIVLKEELRSIPGAQPWLLGVMALRGQLLPVIDLGLRLQGKPSQVTRYSFWTANGLWVSWWTM